MTINDKLVLDNFQGYDLL